MMLVKKPWTLARVVSADMVLPCQSAGLYDSAVEVESITSIFPPIIGLYLSLDTQSVHF